MIELNARSVITTMKDLLLPDGFKNLKDKNWKTMRGLIICLDIRVSDTGEDQIRKEQRRRVSILIAGSHNAFVSEVDHIGVGVAHKPETWINVGNHDSCWIDAVDTKLTEIYFSLCEAVNSEKAPAVLHQSTYMQAFWPVNLVEVELEYDAARNAEHGSNYWKKVVTLKRLTKIEFDAYDRQEIL